MGDQQAPSDAMTRPPDGLRWVRSYLAQCFTIKSVSPGCLITVRLRHAWAAPTRRWPVHASRPGLRQYLVELVTPVVLQIEGQVKTHKQRVFKFPGSFAGHPAGERVFCHPRGRDLLAVHKGPAVSRPDLRELISNIKMLLVGGYRPLEQGRWISEMEW
jgi:hypothetical protein